MGACQSSRSVKERVTESSRDESENKPTQRRAAPHCASSVISNASTRTSTPTPTAPSGKRSSILRPERRVKSPKPKVTFVGNVVLCAADAVDLSVDSGLIEMEFFDTQ